MFLEKLLVWPFAGGGDSVLDLDFVGVLSEHLAAEKTYTLSWLLYDEADLLALLLKLGVRFVDGVPGVF